MARSRFKLPHGNSLSAICFLNSISSIVLLLVAVVTATALQPPVRSYIAEWEFQKHQWKGLNGNSRPLLRHRIDAGYWSEPSGTSGDWWLFGGKGFEKQYSDLWKFHGNTLQWERIYPKSDPIVRAMVAPERIPQPIICGHQTPGRTVLAVYGPKLHTDTVWLYEVNDTLWTSYVCYTEKQNSKHIFCPDFTHVKQSPVAWCDTTNGALLAVVPTSSALQLWRFSLLTTRWEHVSLQLTTPATTNNPKSKIICNFTDESSLLYTFTDGLLYILCSDSNSTLKRYVYRYPNAYGELEPLGIISLNIIPQKISLTATKTNNGRIYLIIGYQQLIDIWLLDENTLSWIAIDNIWKGNSLKWFQAISSNSGIYYLNIDHSYVMLSNPKLNEQKLDGVIQEQGIFMINITVDDGSILRGEYGMKKTTETLTTTTTTTSTTTTETPETTTTTVTTTTTRKIPEITTTSSTTTTTTEWSPELVMEGSPENISTCCWNFTETIVGNDRALLAISPQVNEVTRPLKASPPEKPESKSSYGTIIFFVMSLSLIAVSGAILFVRRCVKCPESNTPTILKEPPPIRYSVIPDELTYPSYPGA